MLQNYGIDPSDGQLKKISKIKNGKSLLDSAELTEDGIKIEGLTDEIYTEVRKRVRSALVTINGMMSTEDKNAVGTNMYLSSAMMFKNWLPGLISARFKNFSTNEFGDYDVGRMKVAFGEFTGKGLMPRLKAFGNLAKEVINMGYFDTHVSQERSEHFYNEYIRKNRLTKEQLSLEDFIELRVAKLKGMAAELRVYLSFALLVFGMRAALPDDEEDPMYKIAVIGYRMLNRGYLEVSFFLSPASVQQVGQNILPHIRMITDLYNLLNNTIEEAGYLITGEEPTKAEDRTRQLYYTSKIFPGVNKVVDMLDVWDTYNPSGRFKR